MVYATQEEIEASDSFYEVLLGDSRLLASIEIKPTFQGGDASAFAAWVNSQLVYPEIAKENGVQGEVKLQFTVMKDGSVGDVKVLKGVDISLDRDSSRIWLLPGHPTICPGGLVLCEFTGWAVEIAEE